MSASSVVPGLSTFSDLFPSEDKRLGILNARSWAEIFPINQKRAITVKKRLSMKWHPDREGGDTDVQIKIQELWDERERYTFEPFFSTDRKLIPLVGDKFCSLVFIEEDRVHFLMKLGVGGFGPSTSDLTLLEAIPNALNKIKVPSHLSESKRNFYLKDVARGMVKISRADNHNGYYWYQAPVEGKVCRLSDALPYVRNKDAAWIISRLMNILCILEFSKVNHYGITPDNLFIDPEAHRVYLLGGWWYARGQNENPLGMCSQAVKYYESKQSPEDRALIDLRCVKDLARVLLSKKEKDPVPSEIRAWVQNPVMISAKGEYKKWSDALETAWGGRAWVPFPVKPEEIYRPLIRINE